MALGLFVACEQTTINNYIVQPDAQGSGGQTGGGSGGTASGGQTGGGSGGTASGGDASVSSGGIDGGPDGSGGDASGVGGTGTGAVSASGGANASGGAGNGGTGGTGTGNDGGPDASCAAVPLQATVKSVNVLLVVDRSASMLETISGSATSKWDAMRQALNVAVGATQASVNYGLEQFPYVAGGASDTCEVPAGAAGIQVPIQNVTDGGSAALAQINAALTDPVTGFTPTAAALAVAYMYFTAGTGASLPGEKYVLLVTDGGPNCNSGLTCSSATCTINMDGNCGPAGSINCCDKTIFGPTVAQLCLDDAGVLNQITQLAAVGIKTIVVGLPGTEVYETYLDAFAVAGGLPASTTSPMYHAVGTAGGAQALTNVLTDVTGGLATSCSIQLTNLPIGADLDNIDVHVDFGAGPVQIPRRVLDAGLDGGTAGWTLVAPDTVLLLGSTCAQVQTLGAQSVSVSLSCTEIPPQ